MNYNFSSKYILRKMRSSLILRLFHSQDLWSPEQLFSIVPYNMPFTKPLGFRCLNLMGDPMWIQFPSQPHYISSCRRRCLHFLLLPPRSHPTLDKTWLKWTTTPLLKESYLSPHRISEFLYERLLSNLISLSDLFMRHFNTFRIGNDREWNQASFVCPFNRPILHYHIQHVITESQDKG